MFEQVFENLRAATVANVQMQQELFKKWVGLWPGVAVAANGRETILQEQKKWLDFVVGLGKRQRETMEAQFSAGLKNIEEAFRLAEVKDPEELRAKTIELWQKTFEYVRHAYEAQMRDCQAVVVKWTELMTKGAAA